MWTAAELTLKVTIQSAKENGTKVQHLELRESRRKTSRARKTCVYAIVPGFADVLIHEFPKKNDAWKFVHTAMKFLTAQ